MRVQRPAPILLPQYCLINNSHLHRSITAPGATSRCRGRDSTLQHRVLAMRAVVQRVKSASVEVGGEIVSKIGPGLLCLIGVKNTDTAQDQEYMSRRIRNFKIWPNAETGKKAWDESVVQRGYEVLLVSQFTLYALAKGNKPDYHLAMAPDKAKEFYSSFVELLRRDYQPERVKDGVFGAMMDVALVNDGPVTMQFDSEVR